MGTILWLIVLYEIFKPKRLKVKLSFKVKADSSEDRKSGD